jgi:hypothetical protein
MLLSKLSRRQMIIFSSLILLIPLINWLIKPGYFNDTLAGFCLGFGLSALILGIFRKEE